MGASFESLHRTGDGPDDAPIRIAIPNKGRISSPVWSLIERSGIHIVDAADRQLISRTLDPHIEILAARSMDIPAYVGSGAADLGVTGHDMVCEQDVAVEELLDLGIGRARLILAVQEESPVQSPEDLCNARIATEFPAITSRYFAQRNIPVTLVRVSGACEAAPYLGIADAIVDLSASGSTLRSNRLREVAELLATSTRLIAYPGSLRDKRDRIDEIVLALASVISAKGQCYLMMNVGREALGEVRRILPGLSGPTVMEVASSEDLVAVHAVVSEERIYRLISQLKKAGARDILVMPIERIIR